MTSGIRFVEVEIRSCPRLVRVDLVVVVVLVNCCCVAIRTWYCRSGCNWKGSVVFGIHTWPGLS